VEKLVRDGKTAVIYSPGFGAGWYTWNTDHPEILFDPTIVHYVETRELEKLKAYTELKYPDLFLGHFQDLSVAWIDQGEEFIIEEYDGNESVKFKKDFEWFTA
jgi:hypothetical protein